MKISRKKVCTIAFNVVQNWIDLLPKRKEISFIFDITLLPKLLVEKMQNLEKDDVFIMNIADDDYTLKSFFSALISSDNIGDLINRNGLSVETVIIDVQEEEDFYANRDGKIFFSFTPKIDGLVVAEHRLISKVTPEDFGVDNRDSVSKTSFDSVKNTHTIKYESGAYYNGEVKNNLRHGIGSYVFKDQKSVCYGNFRDGMLSCDLGMFTSPSTIYYGGFKDFKFNGLGVESFRIDLLGQYELVYIGEYCDGSRGNIGIEFNALYKPTISYKPKNSTHTYMAYYIDKHTYYIGQTINGKPDGFGTMIKYKCQKYVGYFSNGKRHGEGTIYHADERKYVGTFLHDQMNGKGVLYMSNGSKYIGDFKDDEMDGEGELFYHDGRRIVGKFSNSTPSKRCEIFTENLKITRSRLTGRVKETLLLDPADYQVIKDIPGTQFYIGNAFSGKPHCRGYCKYSNGNEYLGWYYNGKFNGYGKLTYANGNTYQGEFKDGKREGYGIYTWSDSETYKGEYVNDMRNGWGVYSFSNGDKYCGEWLDNKKSGRGHYINSKGELTYIGDYFNDEQDGDGHQEYNGGDSYYGEYRKGKKDGLGYLYEKKDNKKYYGGFKDGKPYKTYCLENDYHRSNLRGETPKDATIDKCKLNNNGSFYGAVQIDSETGNMTRCGYGYQIDSKGFSYSGTFSNNLKHDDGILRNPDGETFVGEFKYGRKDGYGVQKTADCTYIGEFFDNEKYGTGIQITSKGDIIIGNFREGKIDGYCIKFLNDGTHTYGRM